MSAQPARKPPVDLTRYVRGLGRHVRQVREFLRLSQDQLAALSGVSQGTISRLEVGKVTHVSLVAVIKISFVFDALLQRIDPQLLSDELHEALRRSVKRPRGVRLPEVPEALRPTPDLALEEAARLFLDVPPAHRATLLAVARAAAAAPLPGGRMASSTGDTAAGDPPPPAQP